MNLSDRIGRQMKLQDLHVLMTVVQAGSMRKAATLLNMAQPHISRSIADLERVLGVRLLDRSSTGIAPTEYGLALLKRSTAAFDELKQGVNELGLLSDPLGGELRIGTGLALAEGIVLAVIERLSHQNPRAVYHVVPGGTLTLLNDLRARRIDLGIAGSSASDLEDDFDAEPLFSEPLVVVTGVESPWARRRTIKLAELINECWTWPALGTMFDALVIEAFRASGLQPPRAKVYTDAINMRMRLAETGSFLAVIPSSIMKVAAKYRLLKVLPVELPTTHRQIAIVTLKNRMLGPLAMRFVRCAREIAKSSSLPQAAHNSAKGPSPPRAI